MAVGSYLRRIALVIVVAFITACGTSTPTPPPITTLTGVVSDRQAVPIAGITVTILGGAQDGLTTTTDSTGRFTFTGTFVLGQSVMLRTSGAGFYLTTTSVVLLARRGSPGSAEADVREFQTLLAPDLVQLVPGAYAATLSADTSCTALAPEFRTHTYDATVQPTPGQNYAVTFNATAAVPDITGLFLAASGQTVGFSMDGDYVEALSPTTFYEFFVGDLVTTSVASPAPSTITFAIPSATITTCQLAPGTPFHSACEFSTTVSQASCAGATLTLTRK